MAKIAVFLLLISLVFLSGCSEKTLIIPQSPIGKGTNIGSALEAPEEGAWGVVIEEWFFDVIAERGFESVRLPIRWSVHSQNTPPYSIDNSFMLRIEEVVTQALEKGLKVIINIHHFEALMTEPDNNTEKFYSLWEQIATHFQDYPDSLFFELLNEPQQNLTTEQWNTLQLEAIRRIKSVDNDRWIIITGAQGGLVDSLHTIKLPNNTDYIIATFHFYEPYLFTHQGAQWLDPAFQTTGVQWPGPPEKPIIPVQAAQEIPEFARWFEHYNQEPYSYNPAGPRPIIQAFEKARNWSRQTGIPVLMGEFGTYNIIDKPSRANWTQFVHQKAEEYSIEWILWDFAGTFGVFDLESREWNETIIGSLFGK